VLAPSATRASSGAARGAYLRSAYRQTILPVVALVVLLPLVPVLVEWLYGAVYAEAARPLQLLAVAVGVEMLLVPVGLLVYPLNRPHLRTVAGAAQLGALGILVFLLLPGWGILGAAAARLGSGLVRAAVLSVGIWMAIRSEDRS
jgi:O-antigen/teichoic acid export membrane protein